MNIQYQVEFFSDWHLSSGLSVAGDVDTAVIKDENNLPYIPGKTLKGMLRHAAKIANTFQPDLIDQAFINRAFGLEQPVFSGENKATDDDLAELDSKNATGQCFFSNAYLPDELQNSIKAQKQQPFLYRKISSTAIDNTTGIAKNQTLRKMETVVPLVLSAYIADVTEEDKPKFKILFQLVKHMGLQRHRGFGRCLFSV